MSRSPLLADRQQPLAIAILGCGPIGSTFALHLALHGHDVTVVARGERLKELQTEEAIVSVKGERAEVKVCAELDTGEAFDLVLVTVLAGQVAAVLPSLKESAAKTIMFMHNTFKPLQFMKDAVGEDRFVFGFPSIVAYFTHGTRRLCYKVVSWPSSFVTKEPWASVFTASGIRAVVREDAESWLRTHAALSVPMMVMCNVAHERHAGITWKEAVLYAQAMCEGFELVKRLGTVITPAALQPLWLMPTSMLAAIMWLLSRLNVMQILGEKGLSEPRMLLAEMTECAEEANCSQVIAVLQSIIIS